MNKRDALVLLDRVRKTRHFTECESISPEINAKYGISDTDAQRLVLASEYVHRASREYNPKFNGLCRKRLVIPRDGGVALFEVYLGDHGDCLYSQPLYSLPNELGAAIEDNFLRWKY